MSTLTPEPWEVALHARLIGSPIDEDTILELFDRVAPDVWGYALQRSRNHREATRVAINAFVTAALHPAIFADGRVPIRLRMMMLVHLDTARSTPAKFGERLRRLGRTGTKPGDQRPHLTVV
jgi:hypothetical protein